MGTLEHSNTPSWWPVVCLLLHPLIVGHQTSLSSCSQRVESCRHYSMFLALLENLKHFNLALPQLKLSPSRWSSGGLQHSSLSVTALLLFFKRREVGFIFLMSTVKSQVRNFLFCRVRADWCLVSGILSIFFYLFIYFWRFSFLKMCKVTFSHSTWNQRDLLPPPALSLAPDLSHSNLKK